MKTVSEQIDKNCWGNGWTQQQKHEIV